MRNDVLHSRKQLELQTRMAKRRIEAIKKALNSGVQSTLNREMDKDTATVIARLYDTSLSNADLCSCISILEMLLSLDGLPPLLHVITNESYDLALREQAARAISVVGCDYVARELETLRFSNSSSLRHLAHVALGIEEMK